MKSTLEYLSNEKYYLISTRKGLRYIFAYDVDDKKELINEQHNVVKWEQNYSLNEHQKNIEKWRQDYLIS